MELVTLEHIQVSDDVERIIVLRKRLGNMKQYELAKELNISTNYLVAIENYRMPVTDKLRKKINTFLKRLEMENRLHGNEDSIIPSK
ncbi:MULTISPECIES: helix-turn-helix domain-containing protein [Metabacillus]|uniref:helix-turn-helix domain-containing protein n=1 Tax=Metabacillus TaxID=2675233 RepID=UPI000C8009A9|nr:MULTISPECIES: helix-turn-helix domain-containing protein [Metabacillus]MCM3443606.1 helix-turn-helix domain-containing protein [Metabacillus halosaccharovorans]PMC34235.1 XRE family transcriptional regulator [Bacillus sp. UMB0899]